MSDQKQTEQENAQLVAEVEHLRKQRDSYYEELKTLREKSEETISAQLRLLSVSLSKEIKEDFFSMMQRAGWIIALVGVIATLGGLWKLSDVIDQAVAKEVQKRNAEITGLRDNAINSLADFKFEAKKALEDIEKEKSSVAETGQKARSAIENTARFSSASASIQSEEEDVITIPVVIHVVYNNAPENISDAQIKSQIEVLNKDFRARNDDISKVPPAFKEVIGDAHIEFALATLDPEGKTVTGITRTKTTRTEFGSNDSVKSAGTGGHDAWNRDKYLNIWVCNLSGGLLGYAQFPDGPTKTDGIVIHHMAFGTTGTAVAPFNKGRSTTSKVALYLNLHHIWGDTEDCTGSDMVADTPNAAGPNFETPMFPHITCNNGPNGDMFMNFMDYVEDDAMYMFTKGQVARMRETLQGPRSKLGRS